MLEIENLTFKGPFKITEIFDIPHECGIYIFYDNNMRPMYIGKTLNLNLLVLNFLKIFHWE